MDEFLKMLLVVDDVMYVLGQPLRGAVNRAVELGEGEDGQVYGAALPAFRGLQVFPAVGQQQDQQQNGSNISEQAHRKRLV